MLRPNQTVSLSSLADLRPLMADLPGPDQEAVAAVQAREPQLTKPPKSLGRLESLTEWLAAWQGRSLPGIYHPVCRIFAGNHGVADLGVSAFPAAVTEQMVLNFEQGGAAVNQLCKAFGIHLSVTALDLDSPTQPFTTGPAMDEATLCKALSTGLSTDLTGADSLSVGEMGIANTTSAAALCLALFGGSPADWTGPGTGVVGAALDTKIKVVAEGAAFHQQAIYALPAQDKGLEALRRLGGRELAAMAGAVLKARHCRVPVILDGYIATAAASSLTPGHPGILDHCLLSHRSREPGHSRLAEELGMDPLLDLGLALGEASGACLAVPLLRAATQCHMGMATFGEAGVADG